MIDVRFAGFELHNVIHNVGIDARPKRRINGHMIGGADATFGGARWSGHSSEDDPEGVLACMVLKAVHEG